MANMHAIKEGMNSVTVENFYNANQSISIPLKKELSPQKNAEILYRKSKNQGIESQKLKENISNKEFQLLKMEEQLETIVSIKEVRELRQFLKDENIGLNSEVEKIQKQLFKRFEVDGFEVLVGKNSTNNDLLTLKYAKKEDYWFHAKDVSGSHTILKTQAGKKVLDVTKEKVAIIAAFYSKRKTDSLCPVIITLKKYVRKPKGFPAGRVVVDKEEIILVNPNDFKEYIKN